MSIVSASKIEVGRRIYSGGRFGGFGVISAVYGEPGRVPVESIVGVVRSGGSSEVDIVYDDGTQSKRLPEAILCGGLPWQVLEEVVSAEKLAELVANSAAYVAAQKAKADEAAAAFAAAKIKAEAEGRALGLMPEAEFRAAGKRGSAAAYNLRLELKAAGIKANVRQDGYSAIYVSLKDDTDKNSAKKILLKYKAGNFNGMEDIYEYSPSAWGSVFGDVQYVFGQSVKGYCF